MKLDGILYDGIGSYTLFHDEHFNMILSFTTEKTRLTTIYLFSYVCCRYNKSNG